MKKEKIREKLVGDYLPESAESLDGVIEELKETQRKFGAQGYTDFKLHAEYYGYDGGKDYEIWGSRMETDEEAQTRIDAAKKLKEKTDAKSLAHRKKIEAEARKLGLLK